MFLNQGPYVSSGFPEYSKEEQWGINGGLRTNCYDRGLTGEKQGWKEDIFRRRLKNTVLEFRNEFYVFCHYYQIIFFPSLFPIYKWYHLIFYRYVVSTTILMGLEDIKLALLIYTWELERTLIVWLLQWSQNLIIWHD